MKRDFLQLSDLSLEEHRSILERADALKSRRHEGRVETTLLGRCLALVFEKPSTRTRLSFEAAMVQLGGNAMVLPHSESQMSRGEPLADTARVVSRYVDAIVLRTSSDERLREFAKAATVPVINGLTDVGHPVQVLADLFTIQERLGAVKGKTVAFVGDGLSNMARSFAEAARLFEFTLRIASPAGFAPSGALADPALAVAGANVVVTDVWTSMGQEAEAEARRRAFRGFCVDEALVARAAPDAIVLHCLPAHRGEEITEAVLEGPRSAVWDEAENRLHVQKALLELLIPQGVARP
ncbi:MAG TPA: ornithine carbamoyltransferase [Myxococcaceae bacterium]|nr:ornithine carbamoyltransferase [Myxococcaceae bacterium]